MSLTKEDQLKLDELQNNLDNALKAKTEWLDLKMVEYTKFKVGDEIYDSNRGGFGSEGRLAGIVTEITRRWRDDSRFDGFGITYYFKDSRGRNCPSDEIQAVTREELIKDWKAKFNEETLERMIKSLDWQKDADLELNKILGI